MICFPNKHTNGFNGFRLVLWYSCHGGLFIKVIYVFTVFLIECNSVLNQTQMFTMKQEMIYTLYLITICTFWILNLEYITMNMFLPNTTGEGLTYDSQACSQWGIRRIRWTLLSSPWAHKEKKVHNSSSCMHNFIVDIFFTNASMLTVLNRCLDLLDLYLHKWTFSQDYL